MFRSTVAKLTMLTKLATLTTLTLTLTLTCLLFAAPSHAGLASIPIGMFTTASPCDGIAGEAVPSGVDEVFIEVEGTRTLLADGTIRFAQGRAQITRVVDGNASMVCLDARGGGSMWITYDTNSVRVTQKRAGVDLVSVRIGAERTTIISSATSSGAVAWDRVHLPRTGGASIEGMVLDPDDGMVLDPDDGMVLDPDDGFAIKKASLTTVIEWFGNVALDKDVVFRAGQGLLRASLPIGEDAPGVSFGYTAGGLGCNVMPWPVFTASDGALTVEMSVDPFFNMGIY